MLVVGHLPLVLAEVVEGPGELLHGVTSQSRVDRFHCLGSGADKGPLVDMVLVEAGQHSAGTLSSLVDFRLTHYHLLAVM